MPWQTMLIVAGIPLSLALFFGWAATFINNGKPVLSANDDESRPIVDWVDE